VLRQDLAETVARASQSVWEHSDVRSEEIQNQWTSAGFVVIDGFLSTDQLEPTVSTLDSMFPTATDFHDDIDPERNKQFRDDFGGIVNFPFSNVELSLLSVHASLVELAEVLLECDDVRAYSIEGWAKYTGAADYEQQLHRDYLNHTLLVPSDDNNFKQVEMFLYLCDVPDDLGPPSFVSREHTDGLPVLPNWYPPADTPVDESGWSSATGSPGLYKEECSGAGTAGTLVAYTTSTFHRGRQLVQPRGARYTIHVNFRPAIAEWAARRSWVEESLTLGWSDFVGRATPDQLALFGVPRPGHRYWTPQTLDGVSVRYPTLDMTPWRDAVGHVPDGRAEGQR
jgi:hypothetical protein